MQAKTTPMINNSTIYKASFIRTSLNGKTAELTQI